MPEGEPRLPEVPLLRHLYGDTLPAPMKRSCESYSQMARCLDGQLGYSDTQHPTDIDKKILNFRRTNCNRLHLWTLYGGLVSHDQGDGLNILD